MTSAAFQRARKMVEWYTAEFQARKRVCSRCGHVAYTVELLLGDLHEMAVALDQNDPDALRALLSKPIDPKKL